MNPTKRIRDPVHGLIRFDLGNEIDRAAWRLLNTGEFQRLRRIKQLGVSEFTFPGATHTRLAHCIGVFHVARSLMRIAVQHIPGVERKEHRERVALLAALLHDLGHGPFSHAFEGAEKARLREHPGRYKDHEKWTAEIITRPGGKIREVLDEAFGGSMADEIAQLLTSEPSDIYSAVVSSSFDADRLDYLQRDKMMTGSGAGAIDFDWLLDNLRITKVQPDLDESTDEPEGPQIATFCFAEKAAQAAEAFILARYHLYAQVYFHKTTRGVEQLLGAFLRTIAKSVIEGRMNALCLPIDHPLVSYYSTETPPLDQYLALDDTVIWSAIEAASRGSDDAASNIAKRLQSRGRLKAVEIAVEHPTPTDRARKTYIENELSDQIDKTIFRDRIPMTVYGGLNATDAKPHKRVRILQAGDERAVDITGVSKAVASLTDEQELLRYYFVDETVCDRVLRIKG